ncbi:hypothetical protein [Kribbella steppae]|uniref:hypothetical protein n=1 Tax=Kribbella steppae TaxID=2512223 RepID=UPI00130D9668|nr:hypothetical protein [Kribbella steppae]
MRRHPRRADGCWHGFDRDNAHALGDHRDCLPGDALALAEDDPHGEEYDTDSDGPDACRWAARWRTAAAALGDSTTADQPLAVVALDPATGPHLVALHANYGTAGPHRTRIGRRSGDALMSEAKARALVVCTWGHLH